MISAPSPASCCPPATASCRGPADTGPTGAIFPPPLQGARPIVEPSVRTGRPLRQHHHRDIGDHRHLLKKACRPGKWRRKIRRQQRGADHLARNAPHLRRQATFVTGRPWRRAATARSAWAGGTLSPTCASAEPEAGSKRVRGHCQTGVTCEQVAEASTWLGSVTRVVARPAPSETNAARP